MFNILSFLSWNLSFSYTNTLLFHLVFSFVSIIYVLLFVRLFVYVYFVSYKRIYLVYQTQDSRILQVMVIQWKPTSVSGNWANDTDHDGNKKKWNELFDYLL